MAHAWSNRSVTTHVLLDLLLPIGSLHYSQWPSNALFSNENYLQVSPKSNSLGYTSKCGTPRTLGSWSYGDAGSLELVHLRAWPWVSISSSPFTHMVYMLPFFWVIQLAPKVFPSARPYDPDTMTITILEAVASRATKAKKWKFKPFQ